MTHRKHGHAFWTITLTVTACLLLWGFQLPAWAGDASRASFHWRVAEAVMALGSLRR